LPGEKETKCDTMLNFKIPVSDTAINIVVKDTLPYTLVSKSFRFLGSSHKAICSLNNNVLTVDFPEIYLPDSSKNKLASVGRFEFEMDIDPGIRSKKPAFITRFLSTLIMLRLFLQIRNIRHIQAMLKRH